MVEIPKDPAWVPITRVETTDIGLGGNLTNVPNKQYYEIAQCLGHLNQRLSQLEGTPYVSSPIADYGALEFASDSTFNLDNVFTDPGSQSLTYSIENNSDPARANASILSNVLTVSYPEWASGTNPIAVTITIRAENPSTAFVLDSFVVTVSPLETLFTENYYAFDNTTEPESADIYVNAAERDNILASSDLSAVYSLSNGGQPVYRAIPANSPSVPATALSNEKIKLVTRFRWTGPDQPTGSYLYTVEPETTTVRANPNFTEEGAAFYGFNAGDNRADPLKRYQYLVNYPNGGDYIYSVGAGSSPGVPPSSYSLEGDVCDVVLI